MVWEIPAGGDWGTGSFHHWKKPKLEKTTAGSGVRKKNTIFF